MTRKQEQPPQEAHAIGAPGAPAPQQTAARPDAGHQAGFTRLLREVLQPARKLPVAHATTTAAVEQPFALPLRDHDGMLPTGLWWHYDATARVEVEHGQIVAPGAAVLSKATPAGRLFVATALGGRIEVTADRIRVRPGASDNTVPARQQESEPHGSTDHAAPTDVAALCARLLDGGVRGLGGAAFPTAVKVLAAAEASTLLINAVECEPGATSDHWVCDHTPAQVAQGAVTLVRVLPIRQIVVAQADSATSASRELITTLQQRLHEADLLAEQAPIRVTTVSVGHDYPAGSESQILALLSPEAERPRPPVGRSAEPASAHGVLSCNVATLVAIDEASRRAHPMTDRIVTCFDAITGRCRNARLPLGLPVLEALQALGFSCEDRQLRIGGIIAGTAFDIESAADETVDASTIALSLVARTPPGSPCIRCAACADVCPPQLQPQILAPAAMAEDWERCAELRLADCFECGACEAVCPAHIPLLAQLEQGQSDFRAAQQADERADWAKTRYERKVAREARREALRTADRAARRAERQRRRAQRAPAANPGDAATPDQT